MYWAASGFIFRTAHSPFQAVDPRLKLLLSAQLFALALTADTAVEMALTVGVVGILVGVARIARRLMRTLAFSAAFAVIVVAVNWLAGLEVALAVLVGIRFVVIISASSFFFLTTSPDELEYVLRWFRLPRDVVFAFATAVRFVPVLFLDALQIVDAQRSRGLELDRGSFLTRIRNTVPILVPLIVTAVIRSSELAEAMEARAYGAVRKPTSLYELRMLWSDWLILVVAVALFSGGIYTFVVSGLSLA